jgi:hypothetical protein
MLAIVSSGKVDNIEKCNVNALSCSNTGSTRSKLVTMDQQEMILTGPLGRQFRTERAIQHK